MGRTATGIVLASHYIPRFLLRNWETGMHIKRYYDFSTQPVRKAGSKSMYVSRVAFADDVGAVAPAGWSRAPWAHTSRGPNRR